MNEVGEVDDQTGCRTHSIGTPMEKAESNQFSTPTTGIVRSHSDSFQRPNVLYGGNAGGNNWFPIDKMGRFHGIMFKYGPKPIQVAFRTGNYKQQVIFVGGLSDGFFATEYLEPLAIALEKEQWSLVQFLLSSSYSGYGTSSLKQEESDGVVLLGHSTGCQDVVHYMRSNGICSKAVRSTILQAPVSDREYKATLPETASMIDLASRMISEGRASELIPREANPESSITAYRYHSLFGYNGDDDLFSSDFSENALKQKLGHMSKVPTLIMFSMADEFVPHYIDKGALVDRLCGAMGGAEKVEMKLGNHRLSNRVDEAVKVIVSFVKRSDGHRLWENPWS